MAVRFVIGTAGSGKTWHCLEAIRKRLRASAGEGGKLLLLVPEQASFQMERALIETPDLAGFTRCEVLSFQRLAYRIFAETGADPRRGDQTIGSLGRMMAIRRLIRRERAGLHLLDRVADKPGFVKQVAGAIDELMRENVEPAVLADLAEQQADEDPLASAKLADLTRLYQAYLDYLIDDRIDPAQYLNLAAERLSLCSWLTDAEVWVDGFAGFARQEYCLLAKLAACVSRMEITMLIEPSASVVTSDTLPALTYSRFARTERTLVRLRHELRSAGVVFADPIRLSASPGPRFVTQELGCLERHLFVSRPHHVDNMASLASSRDSATGPETVRVVEMADRRSEVDAAIAEIQRLTREADPPMHYRDIAVVVRDLDPYHDLLSVAMRSHGIPCFIDRREPTTHHPLVALMGALLAVAADNCRLESVRLMLKTGLLPLSAEDADLLENYLLASGISGRQRWAEPWAYTRFFGGKSEDGQLRDDQLATLQRINTIRVRWLEGVGGWLDAVDDFGAASGRAWAETLFSCLDQMGVGRTLAAWADDAEMDGRHHEADMHRQVWLDLMELLDEFVHALGSEPMRVEEFRETIEAALMEFNLGLAPPTLDQVLVGAIERSRHPAIRAALLLGFDDAHFPMSRSEDPLLGDAERQWLESAGVEIGPPRQRRLLDERMLAYIALTRASERLWISYPRTGEDGKPIQPSPFLEDVRKALPGLVVEKGKDTQLPRLPIGMTNVTRIGARLAAEFRYRPELAEEHDLQLRAFWNALYDTIREQRDWQQTLKRSLGGLRYANVAVLDGRAIDRLVRSPFVASVSRLERFATCPFAHYADYHLRLRERIEADLDVVDLGTLCHAILEGFMKELAERRQNLADLEDDDVAERVDNVAKQVLSQLGNELLLDDPRNAYLHDRSRGHIRRVTRWQRDAGRVGRYRPVAVEYPFGYSGYPGAPLKLTTPGGRTILLRGRIDRVDVAELGDELLGTVIDYKRTTHRALDLTKVYHGLALQLVGYLLALKQGGQSLTGRPIRPVAAFYLPILEPYETVSHPNHEKLKTYQWRGIADASVLQTIDATVEPGGGSRFMSARLKRNGEPYVTSDLAQRDQLTALMAHVGRCMGALADGILDGNIAVDPYRLRRQMPCSYCSYKSICRYEIETQPPRKLDSFAKVEVLRHVTEGGEHG